MKNTFFSVPWSPLGHSSSGKIPPARILPMLLLVLAVLLPGCSDGSSDTPYIPPTPLPTIQTYSCVDSSNVVYTLEIIAYPSGNQLFTPGNSYTLTVSSTEKISTGSVRTVTTSSENIGGNTLFTSTQGILQSSTGKSFTVEVSSGGIIKTFTGTIGFTDNTSISAPTGLKIQSLPAFTSFHLSGFEPSGFEGIYALAYGNGIYVLGGAKGKIAWSDNLSKWYSVSTPFTEEETVWSLVYGTDKFIAVGGATGTGGGG
jgi:hypothetical protein